MNYLVALRNSSIAISSIERAGGHVSERLTPDWSTVNIDYRGHLAHGEGRNLLVARSRAIGVLAQKIRRQGDPIQSQLDAVWGVLIQNFLMDYLVSVTLEKARRAKGNSHG